MTLAYIFNHSSPFHHLPSIEVFYLRQLFYLSVCYLSSPNLLLSAHVGSLDFSFFFTAMILIKKPFCSPCDCPNKINNSTCGELLFLRSYRVTWTHKILLWSTASQKIAKFYMVWLIQISSPKGVVQKTNFVCMFRFHLRFHICFLFFIHLGLSMVN